MTSLARISTWPRLQTWIGRRDCVWCAFVSCPHGRTVWLSTSPPGTYSAVLLFVLGSCRCERHADTLGLADDRQQSFFHMHREIHRWSLVSTKHSENVRTRADYLIIFGCYNGRSRGAQGALSAQRALRGALFTSAPKIGAHSTGLLHVNETSLHWRFWHLLHEKRELLEGLSADKKGGQHWRMTVLK